MMRDSQALQHVWKVLGGPPALLDKVSDEGPNGLLAARVPVMHLARATVAACSLAAAELAGRRADVGGTPRVCVDHGAVATAFTSERHLRVGDNPTTPFAPLSRYWPTADGWVRTHANYPHHRTRLLHALGLSEDQEAHDLVAATGDILSGASAQQVEETVHAAGGLAVAVRTPDQWTDHPQGRAAAAAELVQREQFTDEHHRGFAWAPVRTPAAGVRVLDLTRVIAGPVATRVLAFLGADVLRIDSPYLPEDPQAHADTGFGKRSITLDLERHADRHTFNELLASADVVITGYRPGALDRYGLSADDLSQRRSGLVTAQLSAWGHDGPWHDRRGFDSLVQAASGIAVLQGDPDGRPGALPAQALDHGTGYLLAAAVLRSLTERMETGFGCHLRLSLAATASWLMTLPRVREPATEHDPAPWLTNTWSYLGNLHHARSPIAFTGAASDWARPPGPLGADEAAWRTGMH